MLQLAELGHFFAQELVFKLLCDPLSGVVLVNSGL
jgi:hypothetical protein